MPFHSQPFALSSPAVDAKLVERSQPDHSIKPSNQHSARQAAARRRFWIASVSIKLPPKGKPDRKVAVFDSCRIWTRLLVLRFFHSRNYLMGFGLSPFTS
jgi:hypothetical protein